MHRNPSRRGTVLILVLGLITLFMALILSATVRVFNAGKTVATLQKNVQAHLMLQAAKLYVNKVGGYTGTIGDKFSSTDFPGHPNAGRLGWAHIQGGTEVIATGGSTGGGTGKGSPGSITTSPLTGFEKDLADSMEVRYRYTLTGTGPFTVTLKEVSDNSAYPW
jgi:hypothetical protein